MVGKVCAVSDVLASLLNAQLDVGLGKPILWREVIGNLFGLASALGGARRRLWACLLYTSPSPRDQRGSRMPSSA